MSKPSEEFEQAYDNFLAGVDVDTTMLDCAEFMFNAGRESVGEQAEPVAWVDPVALGSVNRDYDRGFSDAVAECKRLNHPAPAVARPPAEVVRELVEALKNADKIIERQLELIEQRAKGDFLNKRPVVQSLNAHRTRIQKALAKAKEHGL